MHVNIRHNTFLSYFVKEDVKHTAKCKQFPRITQNTFSKQLNCLTEL